jgi:Chalcone isomerase-like
MCINLLCKKSERTLPSYLSNRKISAQLSVTGCLGLSSLGLSSLVLSGLVLSGLVLSSSGAQAQTSINVATTSSAAIPAAVKSVGDLKLMGAGPLRWFGLKVYDARLFGSAELTNVNQWKKLPIALELTYARNIQGSAIAKASDDEIARLGFGTGEQRQRWSSQMSRIFPNVQSGDQIIGIYRPANDGQKASTQFFLNAKPIGTIDDAEFGIAFFSIWLDERTRENSLRTALLSNVGKSQ